MNLERRPDKLLSSDEELTRNGIRYTLVQAVDGNLLDKDQLPAPISDYEGPAVIAISITLASIFRDAMKNDCQRILILEDDIEFHNIEIFKHAIRSLPVDFDLLYLGAQHKQPTERITEHLARVNESYLCHAIGFGRSAIEYLSWAILEHSNESIYSYIQRHRKNSYCVTPNIAFQKHMLSDVSGMIPNYDFILEKEKAFSYKQEGLF